MKVEELFKIDEATDVSSFYQDDEGVGSSTTYLIKLMDMLDGAKRGIGYANKLKNREEKLWHLHNVFINLNKIRGAIAHVSKML